ALLKFRKQKDWHWEHDEESPLTPDQKKTFKGLNYFAPSPDLYFELPLDTNIPNVGKKVIIKTTDGDEQIYLKAGKVKFEVNGEPVEAVVFEDPQQEQYQYYLLFKDQTTGKETYENGRMLQIDPSTSSGQGKIKLIIDFNYAYNPYSSYNDNWGCPITPEENKLPVRIEAGEKTFNS
ncbi:DUF1684 domain-containing protein, partial [Candidatus Curtissbacteria bacterium]|nr:DUF1684 domain-containing protein [Candidatus Curtissbacteria bacterium]